MELTIRTETTPESRHILHLQGSLDFASKQEMVDQALAAINKDGTTGVALDLSGVSFMDSTGLGAIVEISGAAEDAEVAFALIDPSPRVHRVLEMTGLLERWTIESAGD
ncbi:MAG: STAS domain-containing protein [Jatrophihabitans sp.]|uniref:STAS domain-containing protein n=1 Tax=Jatrophihabitans sp. TaxID=1932789 RepID=UPI003F800600